MSQVNKTGSSGPIYLLRQRVVVSGFFIADDGAETSGRGDEVGGRQLISVTPQETPLLLQLFCFVTPLPS